MKDSVYIVFDQKKVVSMHKRRPQAKAGQYLTVMNFEVPDEYFEQATPVVDITIPKEAITMKRLMVIAAKP